MYGLAMATTVPSRPTITMPRATVTRVHHGLPRMRTLVLGAMRPSSSAVMFSGGGPGRSPPAGNPGHLSRSTSTAFPLGTGASTHGDGEPHALAHHEVIDWDASHGFVTAPCSHPGSWIGQTALPARLGPQAECMDDALEMARDQHHLHWAEDSGVTSVRRQALFCRLPDGGGGGLAHCEHRVASRRVMAHTSSRTPGPPTLDG
jgi:hypothetical protein